MNDITWYWCPTHRKLLTGTQVAEQRRYATAQDCHWHGCEVQRLVPDGTDTVVLELIGSAS